MNVALSLTVLGLIDGHDTVVHPHTAGLGPALFAGLSKPVDLTLVIRRKLRSAAVALQ